MSLTPNNPFLDRFLTTVPHEAAGSVTPEQLAAVQRAAGICFTVEHAVNIRRSLRLPREWFYLVLLFGRERTRRG
ncbi:MAG: hypothetical protein EXR09_08485 [Acetobacteraceae bacterium]|nr:hypothetical protein [Acetobacteraceae bacterium]